MVPVFWQKVEAYVNTRYPLSKARVCLTQEEGKELHPLEIPIYFGKQEKTDEGLVETYFFLDEKIEVSKNRLEVFFE